MSNDTIYVLSASGVVTGESMYLKGEYDETHGNLDQIVRQVKDAKIFNTEKEAWEWREQWASSTWQITPISAKRLFTDKLKGS